MGFSSYNEIDAVKFHYGIFRKTVVSTNSAGSWYDDSVMPAQPPQNLYAASPLAAATFVERNGIRHWSLCASQRAEAQLGCGLRRVTRFLNQTTTTTKR